MSTYFEAFADRYKASKLFDNVSSDSLQRYFNSVANYLCNNVLDVYISAYDGVRYDKVNGLIKAAHDQTAMDLGLSILFRTSDESFSFQPNNMPIVQKYIMDRTINPLVKMTYIEYLIVAISDDCRPHEKQEIEGQFNRFARNSGIKIVLQDFVFSLVDDDIIQI